MPTPSPAPLDPDKPSEQVRLPCAGGSAPTATSEIITAADMSGAGAAGEATVWLGISFTPAGATAPQLAKGNAAFAVGPSQVSF